MNDLYSTQNRINFIEFEPLDSQVLVKINGLNYIKK